MVSLPLHSIPEGDGRSSDGPTHAYGRAGLPAGLPELPAGPAQRATVICQRFSAFTAAVEAGSSCQASAGAAVKNNVNEANQLRVIPQEIAATIEKHGLPALGSRTDENGYAAAGRTRPLHA